MSELDAYYELMARLFESRHQHATPALENAFLDEMDLVWHRMSIEERRTAEEKSRSIASGKISEKKFIERYAIKGGHRYASAPQPAPEARIEIQPFRLCNRSRVPRLESLLVKERNT